ncbi:hypothetical protein AGMMS49938_08560 [Fibrobacterales bacterium]|nr:hypothetical protein AGMMS49938_08560 [Fibrobacterales bacterium]
MKNPTEITTAQVLNTCAISLLKVSVPKQRARTAFSRTLAVLIVLFASGAWADEIDMSAPTSGTGYTYSSGFLTITAGTHTLYGNGGSNSVIVNANNLTLTIRGLTLAPGDNKSPLLITPGSTLTLKLVGDNSLLASNNAAGITVPLCTGNNVATVGQGQNQYGTGDCTTANAATLNIVNGDESGSVGSLLVRGGSRGTNYHGGGAAIGSPGINTATYNGDGTGYIAGCGNVTIGGGIIKAYGGSASGNATDDTRGKGAGIGSGGAESNNNGRVGRSCNLTINGGTVTAEGGVTNNGIGQGTYGNNDGAGLQTNRLETTVINGGSVKANVQGTVTRTSNPPVNNTLAMRTIVIGQANKPSQKAVLECKFGDIVCSQDNTAATIGTNEYGIKDVITDGAGNVYFWIPTPSATTTDNTIKVEGYDDIHSGIGLGPYQGPAPSMRVSKAAFDAYESTDQKVIDALALQTPTVAVGLPVSAKKGTYIRNDALEEGAGTAANGRVHTVRWYSSATSDYANPTLLTGNIPGFVSGNAGYSADVYMPTAADYGKYIWAEVVARDAGARPANGTIVDADWNAWRVRYPVLAVGALVNTTVDIPNSEGWENVGTLADVAQLSRVSDGITQTSSAVFRAGAGVYGIKALVVESTEGYKSFWTAPVGKFTATDAAVADALTPENANITPIFYRLPTVEENASADTKVTGDVTLTVTMKSSETPVLTGAVYDGSYAAEYAAGILPYKGYLKLTFAKPVRASATIGKVALRPAGNATDANDVALLYISGTGTNELIYAYKDPEISTPGLDLDKGYSLRVSEFQSSIGVPMAVVDATHYFTTEKKAELAATTVAGNVAMGNIVSKSFNYEANNSGVVTNICVAWQYADTKTGFTEPVTYTCANPVITVAPYTITSAAIPQENYHKYIRAVVYSESARFVGGNNHSAILYGEPDYIGIAVTPSITKEATATTTLANIRLSIDGTDIPLTTSDGGNTYTGAPVVITRSTASIEITAGDAPTDRVDWAITGLGTSAAQTSKENLRFFNLDVSTTSAISATLAATFKDGAAPVVASTGSTVLNTAFTEVDLGSTASNNGAALEIRGTSNPEIKIVFNKSMNTAFAGRIKINDIWLDPAGGVWSTTTKTNDTYTIKYGYEQKTGAQVWADSRLAENLNYTVTVSGSKDASLDGAVGNGFKDAQGNYMIVDEYLVFRTGKRGTITNSTYQAVYAENYVSNLSAETVENATEVGVGNALTVTPSGYTPNNGGVLETPAYTYVWEYSANKSDIFGTLATVATPANGLTSTLTPANSLFGQYVRAVITPKGANLDGTPYISEWVRVGVKIAVKTGSEGFLEIEGSPTVSSSREVAFPGNQLALSANIAAGYNLTWAADPIGETSANLVTHVNGKSSAFQIGNAASIADLENKKAILFTATTKSAIGPAILSATITTIGTSGPADTDIENADLVRSSEGKIIVTFDKAIGTIGSIIVGSTTYGSNAINCDETHKICTLTSYASAGLVPGLDYQVIVTGFKDSEDPANTGVTRNFTIRTAAAPTIALVGTPYIFTNSLGFAVNSAINIPTTIGEYNSEGVTANTAGNHTYQWFSQGGASIVGATGTSYMPSIADFGKTIYAQVTPVGLYINGTPTNVTSQTATIGLVVEGTVKDATYSAVKFGTKTNALLLQTGSVTATATLNAGYKITGWKGYFVNGLGAQVGDEITGFTLNANGSGIITSENFLDLNNYTGAVKFLVYPTTAPATLPEAVATLRTVDAAGTLHPDQPASGATNAVYTDAEINLNFNGAMSSASTATITIDPAITPSANDWTDAATGEYQITATFAPATTYTVLVQGLTDTYGNIQKPLSFSFTTAKAAEFKVDELTGSEFAVDGTGITGNYTYTPNGGSTVPPIDITYQWYRNATTTGNGSKIESATNATYTPTAADFGQYIRLVVKWNDTEYPQSKWVQIGARLIAKDIIFGSGGAQTLAPNAYISIAGHDKETSQNGVVVYGETTIQIKSTDGSVPATVRLSDLSNNAGAWAGLPSPLAGFNFVYSPTSPSGNIEFDAKLVESTPPKLSSLAIIGAITLEHVPVAAGSFTLTFDENDAMDDATPGTVVLTKMSGAVVEAVAGTLIDKTITYTYASALEHGADYTVAVSGFKDVSGNEMFPAQRTFKTSILPTVAPPTLAAITAIVGTPINAFEGTVTPNSATVNSTQTHQWKVGASPSDPNAENATGGGATTLSYTPVSADFGKYIWLESTPAGTSVNGEILNGLPTKSGQAAHVGISLTTNTAIKVNGTTLDAPRTVYDPLTLSVVAPSTDNVKWSATGAGGTFEPNSVASSISTLYTPGEITDGSNVAITATLTDGEPPRVISVQAIDDGASIKITFSEQVNALEGKIITITGNETNTNTYTIPSGGLSSTTTVPYSITIAASSFDPVFVISPDYTYTVSQNVAFEDVPGNLIANGTIGQFSKTGFYAATLAPYTESKSAIYGYSSSSSNDATFTLTKSEGSSEITGLTYTLEKGSNSDFTVTPATGGLIGTTSATITVSPKLGLPVGTYTDVLIITNSVGQINVRGTVSFTVTPAPIVASITGVYGWVYGDAADIPVLDPAYTGTNVDTLYEGIYNSYYGKTPPTAAGAYKITATWKPVGNYAGATDSKLFSITRKPVDKPTLVAPVIYTYSGLPQAVQLTGDGVGYTLAGNSGTNAGPYTATATLDDNHKWADESLDLVSIPWTIEKFALALPTTEYGAVYGTQRGPTPPLLPTGLAGAGTTVSGTWNFVGGSNADLVGTVATPETFKISFTPATDPNYDYTAVTNADFKFKVTPKQLIIDPPTNLSTIQTKTYDGTVNLNGAPTLGDITGKVGDDDVGISVSSASFADKNKGTSKEITIKYALTGTTAPNYLAPGNYSEFVGRIDPASLTLTDPANLTVSKTYDRNTLTTANITDAVIENGAPADYALNGKVESDVVNIGGTPVYAYTSPDVKDNIDLTVAGLTFTGTDADNYILPSLPHTITGKGTISPITIVPGTPIELAAVYGDKRSNLPLGNLPSTVTSPNGEIVGGTWGWWDAVDASVGSPGVNESFSLKFTPTNNNYAPFAQPLKVNVGKRPLTIDSPYLIADKQYDGNNTATVLSVGSINPSSIIEPDIFIEGDVKATATYANATVGNGKIITITYSLSGANVNNYAPPASSFVLGNITKKVLDAGSFDFTGTSKEYNGNNTASVTLALKLGALIGSESITLSNYAPRSEYNDQNAGSKTITVYTDGVVIGGTNAGNYTWPTAGLFTTGGTITKANLVIPTLAATAQYGSQLNQVPTNWSMARGVGNVQVPGSWSWNGEIPDAALVGSVQDTTIIKGAIFTHGDGNYNNPLEKDVALTVTKRKLTVTSPTIDREKVYDGNAKVENIVLGSITNKVGSEDVLLSATATYDTKNVGVGKLITLKYSITGANAANYEKPDDYVAAIGTIKQAKVKLAGCRFESRPYNGSTAVPTPTDCEIQGLPFLEQVGAVSVSLPTSYTYTYNNADAGVNKPISISGYSITGSMVGTDPEIYNYSPELDLSTAFTGTITPAEIWDLYPLEPGENEAEGLERIAGVLGLTTSAVYGEVLSSTLIPSTWPATLGSIFGGANLTTGNWSWDLNGSSIGNVGEKLFKVSFNHSNSNYKPLSGLPATLAVNPKPITVTGIATSRAYIKGDSSVVVTLSSTDAVGSDVLTFVPATGKLEDANSGSDKTIISVSGFAWAGAVSAQTKQNYVLPSTLSNLATITANITKADYPNNPGNPNPIPASHVYDLNWNLSKVALSNGWIWLESGEIPVVGKENYDVTYTPADTNYLVVSSKAKLNILPRNANNKVESVTVDSLGSVCGAASAQLVVIAEDKYASVFYKGKAELDTVGWNVGGTEYTNRGSLTLTNLKYGANDISYEIQAQAYGEENRSQQNYTFNRLLPFEKFAAVIRGKALTITLPDSAGAEETEFMNSHKFVEYTWYNGADSVGTGKSLAINSVGLDSSQYSKYYVIMKDDQGQYYSTCKFSGAYPDVTPIISGGHSDGRGVLTASAYGSRLVAGGTSLVLNTPFGGTVSIFTAKGQLISQSPALNGQTVVRTPDAKGMYVVRFERR